MSPLDLLGRHRILLAAEDNFVATYLSIGLRQWAGEIVGPIRTAAELIAAAETGEPGVACVSVNLPGLDEETQRRLLKHGMPSFLFGVPQSGSAAATALLWPFSTFQVAQEMALLLFSAHPPAGPDGNKAQA